MTGDALSPAMRTILGDVREGHPVDGRSWRAIGALERRGLVARACYHPRSCSSCQARNVACGKHYAGGPGVHQRCTGDPGTLALTDAGRTALAEVTQ
jgi:hypothetical protein